MQHTKPWLYFVAKDEWFLRSIGSVLDMMRYDASEIVDIDSEKVTFASIFNPTIARWDSFGLTAVVPSNPRLIDVAKRPKKELYFLVSRDAVDDRLIHRSEHVDIFLDLLKMDRAIPTSNGPDGFYLFRTPCVTPSFEAWRTFDLPIHVAVKSRTEYAPHEIFDWARQAPFPNDRVIPAR